MKPMSRRDRIRAALNREPVDRIPYAVWRHFPAVDRSPAGLAQSTLRFHERYGSDFLKITPTGGYAVEAWGCVEEEEVRPDGHRGCARCAIRDADDWKTIRPLDPETAPGYAGQIETIVRLGFDRRIGDAPVVPTLFSPLSLARKLSGERLSALEAITETLIRFADRALTEGLAGIFYSIQAASRTLHTEEEYARFGEPFDRTFLQSIEGRSSLTIIHCHGEQLMFDRLAQLPGHAWNWDDRATPPSLKDASAMVPGAVIGGLHQGKTLHGGTADQAVAETQDAIAQTNGRGLIIGPGCVLPMDTPDANVAAVVKELGGALKPLPGVQL
jgi:uroporphyrinogen decarboxylase